MSFFRRFACTNQLRAWAVILAGFAVWGASAQANEGSRRPALEIHNDRGGSLRERISQIQQIRAQSQPVRVVGRICYSTCTMFLGLPQTCVSPDTIFGFHGPSSYGRPLDQDIFDHASRLIADHYPEVLRDWYMDTARHSIIRLHRIRGEELIRLGVAAC